mgnify:CR=1 FL=1|tara:strand:+ start:443 stop:562 length:120 start_codon:yes stop_codon:yes gene_type:complete
MKHQNDQAKAFVTPLTPEPEEKQDDFDEDIDLEEALTTL